MQPTGDEVVSTGVSGLGDFFRQFGGIAITGISRVVDAELPKATHTPDTATTAPIASEKPEPPGISDVFANFSAWQWGGLIVAGGLSWALATGKFR